MFFHALNQRIAADLFAVFVNEKPFRLLRMPNQNMSYHVHIVSFGKGNNFIAQREIEFSLGWLHSFALHAVFGGKRVEMFFYNVDR